MNKGKLIITSDDQPLTKTKKIKKKQHIKLQPSLSLVENCDEEQFQIDRLKQEDLAERQQLQQSKLAHIAICFPDSILEIPQTSALRAYFISQIARISCIFKVDEIVVLKDHAYVSKSQAFVPCEYIARNLQYLQTPQYLRKHLFKKHPDLNNVGIMNPIQATHHLKANQIEQFREGVAMERPTKPGSGSWVDVGLKVQAKMDKLVLPLTRVTLRLKNYDDQYANFYEAEAVSKRTPRIQKGLYWGYDVRIANSLKEMMGKNTYDLIILCNHSSETYNLPQIQNFSGIDLQGKKILIFYSGTDDLTTFIEKDKNAKVTIEQALGRFSYGIRLDTFGVKQLRLEEQLFITLSRLVAYTV